MCIVRGKLYRKCANILFLRIFADGLFVMVFGMDEIMKTLTVYSASAGTGKTYTLAARYIALLMDTAGDRGYRHVLAVTFTNKATAEMKQRILGQLYSISDCEANNSKDKSWNRATADFVSTVRGFMRRSLTDDALAAKARRLCRNILEDYDGMQVQTIDAFLHQLLTGMAHMLGIGADFGVELDSHHVIAAAVDEVMKSEDRENADKKADKDSSFNYLVDYIEERLDEEKSWDVRKNLIAMTKELLKEAVLKDESEIVLNPDKIRRYKQSVDWRKHPGVKTMYALYNKICDCKTKNEINGGRNYYAFIKRVGDTFSGTVNSDDAFRGLGEKDAERLMDDKFLKKISTRPEEIRQTLLEMQMLSNECRKVYLSYVITTRYLNDLAMMGFVKKYVDLNLQEANAILLARTAYVLHTALKPGDADFILEKAGIRYNHIMIDEFQDTSSLQWAVFRELISEILASGGTTLIVGDVKQSIYRWRNGDYSIMQGLMKAGEKTKYDSAVVYMGEDTIYNYVQTIPLRKNFRSQAQVVKFNLQFFDWLCAENSYAYKFKDIYRELTDNWSIADYCNKADANIGYVQVITRKYSNSRSKKDNDYPSRAEVRAENVQRMFLDIVELLNSGVDMSEILILVRYNKEAREIIEQYVKCGFEKHGISLCSNDSFLLESSWSVQAVVNAMKVIANNDKLSATFLMIHNLYVENLSKDLIRLPLCEMAEQIIKLILLDDNGNMRFNDRVYLNSFLDEVASFVVTYGSDIKSFLCYWDEQLYAKAIPASVTDGVRIMTIHTAKGLESKYVFVPFCDWDLNKDRSGSMLWCKAEYEFCDDNAVKLLNIIPAAQQKGMAETKYNIVYDKELQAQCVDSLNLLYVAFTRAADQLYIYTSISNTTDSDDPQTVGNLVYAYVSKENFNVGEKDVIVDSKKEVLSPFEYICKSDSCADYCFCSNDEVIRFRQSQESINYIQSGFEAVESLDTRINTGNLRHDIFANIETISDASKVVEDFYLRSLITSRSEVDAILEEIERVWRNPKMSDWFSGRWKVLREVGIMRPKRDFVDEMEKWKAQPAGTRSLMPRRELRPDRVMMREGKIVVLDFKFGKQNHEKYSRQVKEYMELFNQMGYTDVEGYLWYGFDGELVKI